MMEVATSPQADHRVNNFDFLRLVAAVVVLFSHCFALAGIQGLRDPLECASDNQMTLGTLGVTVFFLISGYLITQSFDSSTSVFRYLKARCLRVFPGLFVVVMLSAFVLGPLSTVLSLADYFRAPGLYSYLNTVTLLTIQWDLPGVFPLNIYKGVVNGSLWSIPYEFFCYLVVACLGLLRLHTSRFVVLCLVVFGVLVDLNFTRIFGELDPHIGQLTYSQLAHYCLPFFCGMLFYCFRSSIQFRPSYAALAVFSIYYTLTFGGLYYFVCLAGGYLLFYFAFHGPVATRGISKHGDFSYGIYLYAFPLQQLIVHISGGVLKPYAQFALALPLSFAFAFASWHLVEKRALLLKKVRVFSRFELYGMLHRRGTALVDYISGYYGLIARRAVPLVILLGGFAAVCYSSYIHPPSLVAFPFRGNQAFFKGGWQAQDINENYRWVSNTAEVRMFSEKPSFKLVVHGFAPDSFTNVKTMTLELGGVPVATCDLTKNREILVEVPYDIGVFTHEFSVKLVFDGAFVPGPGAVDKRSLSALIYSIAVK